MFNKLKTYYKWAIIVAIAVHVLYYLLPHTILEFLGYCLIFFICLGLIFGVFAFIYEFIIKYL